MHTINIYNPFAKIFQLYLVNSLINNKDHINTRTYRQPYILNFFVGGLKFY
jgi:hypothetical protein